MARSTTESSDLSAADRVRRRPHDERLRETGYLSEESFYAGRYYSSPPDQRALIES